MNREYWQVKLCENGLIRISKNNMNIYASCRFKVKENTELNIQ